jgi:hypothetical protein
MRQINPAPIIKTMGLLNAIAMTTPPANAITAIGKIVAIALKQPSQVMPISKSSPPTS